MIKTHHVYNPTGSTVTVGANSVTAHTTAFLTLEDRDAAAFIGGGCSCAQLNPGYAPPNVLMAEEAGVLRGF